MCSFDLVPQRVHSPSWMAVTTVRKLVFAERSPLEGSPCHLAHFSTGPDRIILRSGIESYCFKLRIVYLVERFADIHAAVDQKENRRLKKCGFAISFRSRRIIVLEMRLAYQIKA